MCPKKIVGYDVFRYFGKTGMSGKQNFLEIDDELKCFFECGGEARLDKLCTAVNEKIKK